ncbi:conjugative transfer protein [Legionella busanensis]|uniref:Conjugative transfer protein n=1 Tax=Legionella busanensis TaxID=190655 RepID=A0A378KAG5_9GAMM|nr:type-F conjugative transfer system pilin assembly thiol-disulfide isomerase TrbB [Legionella busanensis]STX81706.1 conjugative transfer protein [Legionella busanensis]
MSRRILLGLVLAFNVFSAEASGAQWLKNLIAEQEEPALYKKVKSNNREAQGFFSIHGLILFYGSRCPHCQQFAPILKRWASHKHADVLPLSLDNEPLPEFPNYGPATTEWINLAFGSNTINYPALFVVNHKTSTLYTVGFGSMTEAELNDRMADLISKIQAYENEGRMQ